LEPDSATNTNIGLSTHVYASEHNHIGMSSAGIHYTHANTILHIHGKSK